MKTFEYTEPTLQELCDWLNNYYRDGKHKFSIKNNNLFLGVDNHTHNEDFWRSFIRNNSLDFAIQNGLNPHISEFKLQISTHPYGDDDYQKIFLFHKPTKAIYHISNQFISVNPETLCYEWD